MKRSRCVAGAESDGCLTSNLDNRHDDDDYGDDMASWSESVQV